MTDRYIFKRKREENWTVLPNDMLCNKELSWEARGLLCYLLSKPKDWTVRKKDLETQSPASEYVVKRILDELEKARYIRREKTRNDKGQWEWHTWVFDEPIPQNMGRGETIPQKTRHGLATDGNLGDIQSTDEQNTTNSEKDFSSFTDDDWTAFLKAGAHDYDKHPVGSSKNKKQLADYPPQHRDLLYPFCQYFRFPFPDEKKKWIKQVDVWVNRNYTPSDVANAIAYVEEQEGWEVYQPASITKAFGKEQTSTAKDPYFKEAK